MGNATASGSGASAIVHEAITPEAAKVFGLDAAAKQKEQNEDWTKWAGLTLAALGAYKQYDMYEKQGELFETQRDAIEKASAIAQSNYYDLYKPQYEWSRNFLQNKVDPFSWGIIQDVTKCLNSICEYTKDTAIEIRAKSKIPAIIAKRQALSRRTMKSSQSGVCCDDNFRYAELSASLMVQAISIGERYEDDKKLKWDSFYAGRKQSAAQIAQNMYSTGSNMLNGASSNIGNATSQIQAGANAGLAATQGMASSLNNQADFWGGLSGLGGALTGDVYGRGFNILGGFNNGMNNTAGIPIRYDPSAKAGVGIQIGNTQGVEIQG
jgi:hypothetical protein